MRALQSNVISSPRSFEGSPLLPPGKRTKQVLLPTPQQKPARELVRVHPHFNPVRSSRSVVLVRREGTSFPLFCDKVGGCRNSSAPSLMKMAAVKHKNIQKRDIMLLGSSPMYLNPTATVYFRLLACVPSSVQRVTTHIFWIRSSFPGV